MQPTDCWQAQALAAFWAADFKDETLDSYARIEAAVAAALAAFSKQITPLPPTTDEPPL